MAKTKKNKSIKKGSLDNYKKQYNIWNPKRTNVNNIYIQYLKKVKQIAEYIFIK